MRPYSLLTVVAVGAVGVIADLSSRLEQQLPLAAADSSAQPLSLIPHLGFGTWNLRPDHANASKAVEAAIVAGYRHIDCAAAYRNEKSVGAGIAAGLKAANLSRTDIWVTSKLWNTHHSPAAVSEAAEQTILDLGVGYLDLYLMHWPVSQSPSGANTIYYRDTWAAMGVLLLSDRIRNIGVANFSPKQMQDLWESDVQPYAHQMELHPYLPQNAWIQWHASRGIHVTAYSPLGNMNPTYDGRKGAPKSLLRNKKVKEIASSAGCSPAQAVLSWGLSRGTSVIPKSQHPEYIRENLAATECELSYKDFEAFEKIGREPFRFNDPRNSWGVDLYEGLDGV